MKRGLSTGKPTKREADRIVACKEGPCVACMLRHDRWGMSAWRIHIGGDYHHLKSGNIRRGHRYGVCLCKWHHVGHPIAGMTPQETRHKYGPSLMDGSRLFHAEYGSDDELLEFQDELIGWDDE